MGPGRYLGHRGAGAVYSFQIDGKKCALKMIQNNDLFQKELRAYKAISLEPSLRGRIYGFLGTVAPYPRYPENVGLGLAHLRGPNLRAHLMALTASENREPLRKEVHETLDRLHRDAGVAHGDITTENVIMHKASPTLALALAKNLNRLNSPDARKVAIELIVDALARVSEEQQACSSSSQPLPLPSTPQILGIHRIAVDAARMYPVLKGCEDSLGTEQLFRNAIAAHEASFARDDYNFLDLRLEWGEFLASRFETREEALDVFDKLLDDLEESMSTNDHQVFRTHAKLVTHEAWSQIFLHEEPGKMKVLAQAMYFRGLRIQRARKAV